MGQDKTMLLVDLQTVSNTSYDAVIVGAGIAGAIVAKKLSEQGKRVLILEAGTGKGLTLEGFQSHVETFYSTVEKNANAPYPVNPNALSPTDGANYYFEEQGPLPLSGSYTRVLGGTTMHWEGKTIRMLPEDFQLRTLYGQGLDWPIRYEDMMPYYRQAEYEIGVSGSVEGQKALGVPFKEGYVFPMVELPPSYLDQKVGEKIHGTTVELYGKSIKLDLSTFPQGRNSVPNPDYKRPTYNGELRSDDFVPEGVASDQPVEYGERCQGNANCVPICPVQAKYDARKTLNTIAFPERVHILPQAVVYEVEVDSANGKVTGVKYKLYEDKDSPQHDVYTVTGKLYVLAAHAVENAKILLSSPQIPNTNGLIGRHLMDHPFLLAWGLMPEVTGTMRGPLVTSGICTFRKGDFRQHQCGFAMDIHNDGWGWSGTGATDIVRKAIEKEKKYGKELRQELISKISRQILLAFMCELPADSSNRVTIDDQYVDKLGNYRPVIHFDVPDYCKKTFAYTRQLSRKIFKDLGAEDSTHYDDTDPAYFEYEGESYWFRGGNHFSGTHVMGTNKDNSVVDENMRSWEHENLYLVGSGSMPSIGSSNTTLSIAALTFKACEQMLKQL
jgi:choline dehydrogenase-like flavoprotein